MGQGQQWLKITDFISRSLIHLFFSLLVSMLLCHWASWKVAAFPSASMATPTVTLASATMPSLACPANCVCTGTSESKMVSCTISSLNSLRQPLPLSTVSLNLQNNKLHHLDTNLTSLPMLQHLDLSNNSLSALTNDSLSDLFQLKHLDLSFNAVDTIIPGVFESLTAIEQLNLAHNHLTKLDNHLLFGLQNVHELNLTSNFISELSSKTFLYLYQLETLDLSYNNLKELPHNAFQGLVAVKTIYLHHNFLHSVHAVFGRLPQLQLLDLSHNMLNNLQDDIFAGLPVLHTLNLSFNNITSISPQFCGNAPSVETLNLRNNRITRLPGPVFGAMQELHHLDLSQMPSLHYISFDAFEGIHALKQLNLSHNPQLSFLNPQLLFPLSQLVLVDLSSNGLPTLSKVFFHGNHQLHSLFLADNPWECGCGLAWLEDMAEKSILRDYQLLQCSQQPDVITKHNVAQTVPLYHVSQELMQCNNVTLLNVTSVISARIGSQVVLRCDYEADKNGVLTWLTPRGLVFHYHPFHPQATAHLTENDETGNLTGEFHTSHEWHNVSSYNSDLHSNSKHVVLQADGSLYIDYVLRSDAGPYHCMVHNSQYNATASITLRLDYQVLFEVKKMSILVGFACAASFFTLNAVYVVIVWTANKLVNKRRRERIRSLLESLDEYRTSQMARIRSNYSNQLTRIREHYNTQSMRLRLNYTTQMKRMRRGYSNQCERIRDNYHTRMGHLKDYTSHQIHQIREATNNQIVRMRDYGVLQMERIRETYKLQHQHVMKILEAMNLDNCRTVVETECMRTESMIFDVNFSPDFDDTSNEEVSSQNSPTPSVYATALNSDDSSQESLVTMTDSVQVAELYADALPNVCDPVLSSDTTPLPDDGCSNTSSESQTLNSKTHSSYSDDSMRETIV